MPTARKSAASKASAKQEVIFDQDRETKGTFRFREDAEDGQRPIMGSIWIRKDIYEKLNLGSTESVKVTLEVAPSE